MEFLYKVSLPHSVTLKLAGPAGGGSVRYYISSYPLGISEDEHAVV
jgi:hypothetical protein